MQRSLHNKIPIREIQIKGQSRQFVHQSVPPKQCRDIRLKCAGLLINLITVLLTAESQLFREQKAINSEIKAKIQDTFVHFFFVSS